MKKMNAFKEKINAAQLFGRSKTLMSSVLLACFLIFSFNGLQAACSDYPGDGTTNAAGQKILYFGASNDFPSPTGPFGSATNPITDWNSNSNSGMDALRDCAGNIEMRFISCYYNTNNGFGDINFSDVLTTANINNVTLEGGGAFMENLAASSAFLRLCERDGWTIRNFTFSGWNGPDGGALGIYGCTNTLIENVIFDSNPTTTPLHIDVGDNFTCGYANSSTTINNCVFSNNPPVSETVSTGGLEIEHTAGSGNFTLDVTINNTDFYCNARQGMGGALTIQNDDDMELNVTINGGTFGGNHGDANASDGGGIYVEGEETTLIIDGTLFSCNDTEANVGESGGGAIRIFDGPTTTISNATFYGNTSFDNGGAIHFTTVGPTGALTITNTAFVENTAGSEGGALYLEGGTSTTINNALFLNNSANGGGAIHVESGATLTYMNTTFTGNAPNNIDEDGTVTNNGGASTVPDPAITACVACTAPVPAPTGGCTVNGGTPAIDDCVLLCSTGDDSETGPNPMTDPGQAFDLTLTFTPPACATATDFTYIWLIVDNTGNIVATQAATDGDANGIPDAAEGTPESFDFETLGITPGTYNIYGYIYETATGTAPLVGTNISALDAMATGTNTAFCDDLSAPSPDITVLNPILINITTTCTGAAAGEFNATLTITGGYPEFNGSGTYVITDNNVVTSGGATVTTGAGFTSPYTFGTPQTSGETYVATATLEVQVTSDGNMTADANCTDCSSMVVSEPHLLCIACPDITDGSLAIQGAPAPTAVCDGDMVIVCVDVDLTNDPTAVVEFSNDGGTTFMDGTPNGTTPPTQFCFTFTETNTTCNATTTSYQARFRANSLANNMCGTDDQPITGGAAVSVDVFPDLNDLVTSGDITLIGNNTCGPSITQNCSFTVTNNFDGNGANPDFSTTTVNGAVVFTITQTGAPTGCASITIPANYNCAAVVPSIAIDKDDSTPGTPDTDGDDTQTIVTNGTATFTITVTNDGTEPMCNISVADANSAGCMMTVANLLPLIMAQGNNDGILDAGESFSYTCTEANVAASFTNTAIVNAEDCNTNMPYTDNDPTQVVVVNPSITVDKDDSTPGTPDTDGDDTQTIVTNGTATFSITVTNNGTEALCNLSITDANSADCAMTVAEVATLVSAQGNNDAILDPTESITFTCTETNVAASFTNTVVVNAEGCTTGTAVTDNDPTQVVVVNPSITVDKDDSTPGTPDTDGDDTQTIVTNGTATFSITVTNNGTEALCNLSITDANSADCAMTVADVATLVSAQGNNDAILDPTESITFTCTESNVAASFTNTVVVNAEGCTTGTTVTDNDPTQVVVVNPSITVDKDDSTPGTPDTDGDDTQTIVTNGTATFSITVTNNGTEALCNLSITDANSADCAMTAAEVATLVSAQGNNDAILDPTESITFTCTESNVTASFTNTVVVNAEGCTTGTTVTDNDPTQVVVVNPSITVDKDDSTPGTPDTDGDDTQTIASNGTATFSITVTNNGTEALCNLSITDANSADCAMTAAEVATLVSAQGNNDAILDPTESITFTCTESNVAASFTNTVVVNAEGCTTGTTVTDNDPTQVVVVNPSITVDKDDSTPGTPDTDGDDTQIAAVDGTATFTITVTNNGTEDMCNISVTDANSANCAMTVAETAVLIMGQGNGDNILNPAESFTYTCTEMNVTAGFTNTAVVNAEGCTTGTPVTDTDNTQVVVPLLTADKTSTFVDANSDSQLNPGEQVDYTIVLTNSGDGDALNVLFSDMIPTGTAYVPSTLTTTQGTVDDSGDPLTANLGTVAANGGTVTIMFSVTINDPFTNVPSTIENQGIFTSGNHPNVPTDDPNDPTNDPTDPDDPGDPTVDPVQEPLLLADKTSTFVDANTDGQLNPGEQVDYTIVITNSGNGDALAVMFSDMIPTGTTYVGGTLTTTQGTVDDSGDPLTGNLGTVAANGGTVTIMFSVTVDNPFTNVPATIDNQGIFTSTNHPNVPTDDPTDPTNDPTDPDDPGDPTVDPVSSPILTADKTSTFIDANTDGQLNPGEQVDYTIVITNSGDGDALAVMFSDMIPTGTSYVAGTLTTTQGTVDDSGDPLTGNLGTITANGGTVTIMFSVTVANPFTNVPATIENQGIFTSTNHPLVPTDDPNDPTNDPMDPNDPGDPTVDPVQEPLLLADKTSTFVDANNDGNLNPGEQVDYTIVITNSGNGDALAVMFSDMIPTGTSYVAGTLTTTQGTVDDSGDPLTANLGTVAANGGTVTIMFSVTINNPFTNVPLQVDNQGIFTSTNHPLVPTDDPNDPTNDPTDPNDPGDPTVDPVLFPILIADKTSTFVDANTDSQLNPGEQVDYTIVLTNNGNGDAENVLFADMIPMGTSYVAGTLTTTQGTVDDSGDPLTGNLGTVVANGGTVTIMFSVTINDPFNNPSGAIENQGVFTSTNHPLVPTDDPNDPTNDPTDPDDPGDPTIDPVAQPVLMSTKTSTFDDANADGVLNPTEQVNYTIILTNSGAADAINVTFSDMIPVGTTYVPGTLMTTQGTVNDSADPLTGVLGTVVANGGTVTITFSVTVDNPFTNDPAIIENQAIFDADNHPPVLSDDPTDPTNDPMNPGDPADPTLDPVGTTVIVLNDPCNCLDNESDAGDDGQFTETITIMGPANQTWTIQSVDGLFSTTSPSPPAAPVPFPANFQLTETSPGTYILVGIHVDAIGFTVTLTDGTNTVTVPDVGRNTCFYPEGALLGLAPSYCSDDMSTIAVTANLDNNPAGTITNFEIVGATNFNVAGNTLSFVPSDLAAGTYTVRYEFDAEDATVNDPTDPGCMIVLEETFIIDEPLLILCRPPVNTSADNDNCGSSDILLLPPVVLNGGVGELTVTNDAPTDYPLGTTTVNWTIEDDNGCSAACSQTVIISDNIPPVIDCGSSFQANTSWNNCGYPLSVIPATTATDNCGILSIVTDAPSFFEPGSYMINWTATDVNGNQSTCMQWVKVFDTTLPKLTSCPEDIEVPAQTADGATATWAQPTAMDNCPGDIIWVSTHDSGDFFPLGTTDVVYTAYDQNGQSIDCEFTVTVTSGGDPNIVIGGLIATEFDEGIQDVEVHINGEISDIFMTTEDGLYDFSVPFGGDYSVTPEKDINYLNGVSTFDLVLINKHILGIEALDSPYKMIAADVNKSNSITTLDLVHLRKLILLIDSEFSNNTSWRFVNKAFEFADATNPFGEDFPEVINFNNLSESALNADFVGIKIGDVNGNAFANNLLGADDRTGETVLNLQTKNRQMQAGETYEIEINATDFDHLGMQLTLNFDTEKVTFENVESDLAKAENFGLTLLEEGAITMSWFEANSRKLTSETALIRLTVTAKATTTLAEVLSINSKYTTAEAYTSTNELQTVALNFGATAATNFKLYQNVPNPFANETFIGFDLPTAAVATLTISDITGKMIYQITDDFAKGYNRIQLNKSNLPTNGVWYYQLKTATDSATGKMILIKE